MHADAAQCSVCAQVSLQQSHPVAKAFEKREREVMRTLHAAVAWASPATLGSSRCIPATPLAMVALSSDSWPDAVDSEAPLELAP